MGDWKDKLRNTELYKAGGRVMKKCKCSKPIRDERFDTCYDCSQKKTGAASLPEGYLVNGYFDEKENFREGIFKDEAKDVARVLAALRMTPTSLRAFYNKLVAIENKYKSSDNNFDLIKPNIYAFERDVAYQVSRGVVSEEFRKFINKNAELAKKGPKEFKGFKEHFLSVLAYFKDVSR